MNNENTEHPLKKKIPFKHLYNLISKKNQDKVFGEMYLYNTKENNSKLIGIKQLKTETEEEHAYTIKLAQERLALNHPSLLKMIDYSAHHKNERENKNNFKIKKVFEIPAKTLEDDLIERKKSQNYYSSDLLFELGEDILNGIKFLRINEKSHNNLSPHFIALKDEKNKYRLIDCFEENKNNEEIQIENINSKKDIYQSPSLFVFLTSNKGSYNRYKTDLFSLGLILLEMGCLKNVQDFYDFENKDVKAEVLVGLIFEFLGRYGENELLKDMVMMLLDVDEDSRRGVREIHKILLQEKGKINGRKLLELHEGDAQKINPYKNILEGFNGNQNERILNTNPNTRISNNYQNDRVSNISNNNQIHRVSNPITVDQRISNGNYTQRTNNRVSYTKSYYPNQVRSKSSVIVKKSVGYDQSNLKKSNVYGNVDVRQNHNSINVKRDGLQDNGEKRLSNVERTIIRTYKH